MTTNQNQAPQQTSVSAMSAQVQVLFLIVGFLILCTVFIETKIPDGVIPKWLFRHPREMRMMAGLLAFPVLLFGFLDYTQARRYEYRPPSLRVQISRAAAYGLALGGSNILLVVSLSPDMVLALGRPAIWLPVWTVVSAPLAIVAWFVCLRRREFDVATLASYQDIVDAYVDSDDFVLGIASTDPKSSTGAQQTWALIPEKGMCGNIYVLGGIGSGKTSSIAKPMMDQALHKWPHTPDRKCGLFALDAKGNLAKWISERAAHAGRADDVIILSPGGKWSYNPLGYGSPTAVAQKLVAALETMTDQEPNSYYQKMQREFAENAMMVLTEALPTRPTMMDLYQFIVEPDFQKKILATAAPKNSIAYRWFITQWQREDPKEQMMLTKGFRADLNQFVGPDIAPTFANSVPNFPGWECLLDQGKIVVFSMSIDEYGRFARALGIFVLMDFQSVMLARTTPRFKSQGHNDTRLILACLDEVWAYMNPELPNFTSVSREAKCCTLALHQSLGQILNENMRQTVLANFRTPLILSINDLLSLTTFEQLFGQHKVLRRSISESSGFQGVERQILSDHMDAKLGGESKTLSTSFAEADEARFTADEIIHLQKNHAILQLFDGEITHNARVIQTLPNYDERYQLP